ncbi:MAG: leucine-rich repeat domain-containing protein [Clostridiales bacterium]|nr:leucine-rich repeat domain-containing protein [Clostridiales bacterium]
MRQGKNHQYEYVIEDGKATIVKYTGSENHVRIPESLESCPVETIGARAFADNLAEIQTVTVPSCVRTIGEEAFANCFFLEKLNLEAGIEILEKGCLRLTAIQELYFPPTLQKLEGPEEMDSMAWNVDPENPWYLTDGYGLYYREADGTVLLTIQLGDERPEYEILPGTAVIAHRAFCHQEYVRKVTCPQSLREIGEEAFLHCSELREVSLNEGLIALREGVFKTCSKLTAIALPSTLSELGKGSLDTFRWDGEAQNLRKVDVHPDNPYFYTDGKALFRKGDDRKKEIIKYYCNEIRYQVPEGTQVIGPEAFSRSLLRTLILPNTLKEIKKGGLDNCKDLLQLVIRPDKGEIYLPPIAFRKKEILDLAEGTGPLFHYEAYDDLFETFPYAEYRMKMAFCRLNHPAGLTEKNHDKYMDFLRKNLKLLLEDIGQRNDMESLENLGELGILTKENLDETLDLLSESNQPDLMGLLLDFRHRKFGVMSLDLDL